MNTDVDCVRAGLMKSGSVAALCGARLSEGNCLAFRAGRPFDSLRSLRALDSSEGRRPRAKSAERTSRAGEGQRVRGTYTQPETGSCQGGMSSGETSMVDGRTDAVPW